MFGSGTRSAATVPASSRTPAANTVASDPATIPPAKLAALTTPAAVNLGARLPSIWCTEPFPALATYTSPASSSPNVVMVKPDANSCRLVQPFPCRSTPQIRPLQ